MIVLAAFAWDASVDAPGVWSQLAMTAFTTITQVVLFFLVLLILLLLQSVLLSAHYFSPDSTALEFVCSNCLVQDGY